MMEIMEKQSNQYEVILHKQWHALIEGIVWFILWRIFFDQNFVIDFSLLESTLPYSFDSIIF